MQFSLFVSQDFSTVPKTFFPKLLRHKGTAQVEVRSCKLATSIIQNKTKIFECNLLVFTSSWNCFLVVQLPFETIKKFNSKNVERVRNLFIALNWNTPTPLLKSLPPTSIWTWNCLRLKQHCFAIRYLKLSFSCNVTRWTPLIPYVTVPKKSSHRKIILETCFYVCQWTICFNGPKLVFRYTEENSNSKFGYKKFHPNLLISLE